MLRKLTHIPTTINTIYNNIDKLQSYIENKRFNMECNAGDSLIEIAKTVPMGSIAYISINNLNKPIDSPFKNSEFGIIVIDNTSRAHIKAINIVGEVYVNMASGHQFGFNGWKCVHI